jgi:hypothetical protein
MAGRTGSSSPIYTADGRRLRPNPTLFMLKLRVTLGYPPISIKELRR